MGASRILGLSEISGKMIATSSMIATGNSAPANEPVMSLTVETNAGPTNPAQPHAVMFKP